MDSIFVTHGTAGAVPIWFVTAASYPEVRKVLDTPRAWRYAAAPQSLARAV